MLKITDENYSLYKQVFEVLWIFKANLIQVDPNISYSPIKVLDNWEKQSKSIAKKALKIGLNDIVTMFIDLDNDAKKNINDKLSAKDLPNFYQLIGTIKDTIQKALKKGKIKNLDEYYIIKEFIDNQSSDISLVDRQQLNLIFIEFETSFATKKNAS